MPLLELLKAAREAERLAEKDLIAAIQSHRKGDQSVDAALLRMNTAHSRVMDIWDQLRESALGE